jgi:hypothetical protein
LPLLVQEERGELADVFASLAQRGQVEADASDAEIQIFSETTVTGPLVEGAVRGRDDAHVDGHAPLGADRHHDALLQHAQQSHLVLQRHFADLVEEERAPLRAADEPESVALGTRERSTDVTEQLARQQVGRDGAAVDRDEGAGRARALAMNLPGRHLLARPRLALQKHGNVVRGDAPEPSAERLHHRGGADQLGASSRDGPPRDSLLRVGQLRAQPSSLLRAAQQAHRVRGEEADELLVSLGERPRVRRHVERADDRPALGQRRCQHRGQIVGQQARRARQDRIQTGIDEAHGATFVLHPREHGVADQVRGLGEIADLGRLETHRLGLLWREPHQRRTHPTGEREDVFQERFRE